MGCAKWNQSVNRTAFVTRCRESGSGCCFAATAGAEEPLPNILKATGRSSLGCVTSKAIRSIQFTVCPLKILGAFNWPAPGLELPVHKQTRLPSNGPMSLCATRQHVSRVRGTWLHLCFARVADCAVGRDVKGALPGIVLLSHKRRQDLQV